MFLVCIKDKREYKKCSCDKPDDETHAWILVTKKEMQHFFKTGLVPDCGAELMSEHSKPIYVPLVHPPVYDFKTGIPEIDNRGDK
jgi:hypothetical protein